MNRAEDFVYRVCRHSFLSLWSYANPKGRNGKELCDILVVCEPDIVIFSVKDISLTDSGDVSLDWERWRKRAIDASCRQLYGAERWITSAAHVIRKDGTSGLPFPRGPECRMHRVAVALGGEGKVPFQYGDLGKGFVHVFDDTSFTIVLRELNTVSDFVTYLSDKERWVTSGVRHAPVASEEDLLALYLRKGRQFPEGYDFVLVDGTLWEGFASSPEYESRKLADEDSYVWDNLIETFCNGALSGNLEKSLDGGFEFASSLTDVEMAVRTMAREDRFSRRILGKQFLEFLQLSGEGRVRSRMLTSPSGVLYVFLAVPHGEDRKYRVAELGARCFVARGLHLDCKTVVGIATECYEPGKGFSLDLVYLYKETWTHEDQVRVKSVQEEFGYFVNPRRTAAHEDEYPTGGAL